jgi:two-component system nitrogen regulation sensor histidine kinase NtrY
MTNSYHINIIIRILLIVISSIYTGWLVSSGKPIYNSIALLLLVIIQAVNLIWYINRFNRKIVYFFDAVKNEDYSLSFPSKKVDTLTNKLNQNLKRINEHIEKIRIETINQEKYFEALIEHVSVGIMSINNDGFVINSNYNLRKLLGLKQLTHIRQIEKIDIKLARLIEKIQANDERTITLKNADGLVTLLVKTTSFKNSNQQLKLISMQDIKKELDEKELDSWLKLIRVLTHEIMNSIAPVTSLSENLCNQFVKEGEPIKVENVDDHLIQRTIQGLRVIREQGNDLTRFVENYRKLTKLPKPEISEVLVKNLFEKALILFKSIYSDNQIDISSELENDTQTLRVDEGQILQVLINLLKNAADALTYISNPMIKLTCWANKEGKVIVSVTDNGPGIPLELLDEIFVPFFTTRENGNGIGLSISRQLVRLNNGSLKVRSAANMETTFSLHFS